MRDRTIELSFGESGKTGALPYEIVKIARFIARRTGKPFGRVLQGLLLEIVSRGCAHPESAGLCEKADRRYCNLEDIPYEEYAFRKCQEALRSELSALRRGLKTI